MPLFNRGKSSGNPKCPRLHKKIEVHRKELEKGKNKLNELEQVNDANSALNSNSIRMDLNQKDEYINILIIQVLELKLVNKERNDLIKNLNDKIETLSSNIEVFRNNFKMANKERNQNTIKINDVITKSAYVEDRYISVVVKHKTVLKKESQPSLTSQTLSNLGRRIRI
ncbi:hypothetical protein C2G38_2143563 [Gigaspora rosea]|uniref:Uncharacterized protein n=1 Tax=Gigaspora rosea TaxID=44941 RepID=A0A397V0M1_9GLOM|nr:hypothetical protein C2G38_2143563 [Gigaspora rosea]